MLAAAIPPPFRDRIRAMHAYRTHNCSQLRESEVGLDVRISGWVHRVRDHGGLLFVDLRDHYGMTQIVADPDSAAFAEIERLRPETVIRVDGAVRARTPDTVNPELDTGRIEVFCRELEILGPAEDLPLPVFGEPTYPEEIRLRYRYLDLRRPRLHRRIALRSRIISSLRRRMEAAGFLELQTPILTASSPEGARDFLVPSRLHPGKFYALPQAPQQYKQLTMIAGFDRYFQIAPCFRDEDARADRSPGEFYQLDVEMAFVEQDDVLRTVEPVLRDLFREFGDGRRVDAPFPRITWQDAMDRYGTDKPDLRNPIVIQQVSKHFAGSGFATFANILARDPSAEIRALPAPGGGSRAFCDRMNRWAQELEQPGLAYIFFREEEGEVRGAGPVARHLGPEQTQALRDDLGLAPGDAVFFAAGPPRDIDAFAASARQRIGEQLKLVDADRFAFCWIVDFPMFELDDQGRIGFSHNPFSMPKGGMAALAEQPPLDVRGWQYDIVCNGIELSSGAIRCHRLDVLYRSFEIAGYDRDAVDRDFSGLVEALRHGAPPHGGIAPGIDRMVMLLAGVDNLREAVMFPLSQRAEERMLGAPSEATAEMLRELGLRRAPPS